MSSAPYRVRIVVDQGFGERLAHLPTDEPVWIVESPANTPVAKRLWSERPGGDHLTGITTFHASADQRDSLLLGILDQVDLHHGQYSADPPYSEIEIYGVGLSGAIEHALRDLGFASFLPTTDGVFASRNAN